MADEGVLRLVTKAARLYHTHGLRQTEIATRLGISQSKVSRLLQQAEEMRIVRTVVATPLHLYPELEETIEGRYGLSEVHVVDVVDDGDDAELVRDLAAAAAAIMSDLSQEAPTVAWTSWSRTLRATVDTLLPLRLGTEHVVEMVGDLGPPHLQHEAARSTAQLATLLGAEPVFLRTPGVVPTAEVASLIVGEDGYAREALDMLNDVDLALISVGALEPSSPLEPGRGFFTKAQLAEVRKAGAVGEVCLRYVDAEGQPVASSLDELTIGVTLEQLARARRRWTVVGGASKHAAIRAVLTGGYVDVLVTDVATARHLADDGNGRRQR